MQFQRTIGVDYSGAETADSSLKGLRVYMTDRGGSAFEVVPPRGPKRYWTRRGLADWLIEILGEPVPTIAGIDHGFSFPEAYFARHGLSRDWDGFLEDFCIYWPTDRANLYVDFLRVGPGATGRARTEERTWRRHAEIPSKAKSVFHFDVQGQVAKATHAGLPFLRALRRALPDLHIWPFDGWKVPSGRSCLVEAYPRIYSGAYDAGDRTPDQHDAYSTARWLCDTDQDGRLTAALTPDLPEAVREAARYEGWILGVTEAEAPAKLRRTSGRGEGSVAPSTRPGYRNRNGQIVIRATGRPGTDHNQKVYHLACERCGLNYGANGSDVHLRKCPSCGGGRPGFAV